MSFKLTAWMCRAKVKPIHYSLTLSERTYLWSPVGPTGTNQLALMNPNLSNWNPATVQCSDTSPRQVSENQENTESSNGKAK